LVDSDDENFNAIDAQKLIHKKSKPLWCC
jgi:hypothetical protein